MDYPARKPNRLKAYDYSQNGAYFITICTEGKKPVLSTLCGGGVQLLPPGGICKAEIERLSESFPIAVDKYVIMPNHVHLLVSVQREDPHPVGEGLAPPAHPKTSCVPASPVGEGLAPPAVPRPLLSAGRASPSPTVGDMICTFKSKSTIAANRFNGSPGHRLWQRSYHDHIIRSRQEYLEIWRYIDENPIKWADDCYFEQ